MPDILPLFTILPEADESRWKYAYFGQRILRGREGVRFQPFYAHDDARNPLMLMLGEAKEAKEAFLTSLAIRDISMGRSVIYIDSGTHAQHLQTRNKLSYWCEHWLKRPILSLLPESSGKQSTHTWNPLISSALHGGMLTDILLSTFEWTQDVEAHIPGMSGKKASPGMRNRNLEFQKEILEKLLDIVGRAGYVANARDLIELIQNNKICEQVLAHATDSSSRKLWTEWMRERIPLRYGPRAAELIEFLSYLTHWSLCSYAPLIELDLLPSKNTLLYVGLNAKNRASSVVGNLILRQLETLFSAHKIKNPSTPLTLIIDGAAHFLDEDTLQWIFQNQGVGELQVICSFEKAQQLKHFESALKEDFTSWKGILTIFQTADLATLEWFCRQSARRARQTGSSFDIKPENIEALQEKHYLLYSEHIGQPMLLTPPNLPDGGDRADLHYQHKINPSLMGSSSDSSQKESQKQKQQGLFLHRLKSYPQSQTIIEQR